MDLYETNKPFFKTVENINEITPLKNPNLLSRITDSVDVLEPADDGNEFIVKTIGDFTMNFTKCYDINNAYGRYYGDLFPLFKNTLYDYFKKESC
ncbi:MAG: hypothetical protein Q4P18_08280 [Methanobrevibacter sp.]|uniref:hypothetical protein n=1 Tax=Methanobrevibacter sp. TaxID=66852 RepID=UPI0026E0E90B|nr:hypothetical protein [Methanobrevibacter sp.]MDO5849519.1 hypothetical protein [Methanobrevibacter sp.]